MDAIRAADSTRRNARDANRAGRDVARRASRAGVEEVGALANKRHVRSSRQQRQGGDGDDQRLGERHC